MKQRWAAWLSSGSFSNGTHERLAELGVVHAPEGADDAAGLGVIIADLNALMGGAEIDRGRLEDGAPSVLQALDRIRTSAKAGSYAISADVSAADIAAGLVLFAGIDLAQPLATFLLDSAVARRDRSPALD